MAWYGVGGAVPVQNVHFLPGGRLLAADYNGGVHILDAKSGSLIRRIASTDGSLICAAVLEGGGRVVVTDHNTVRLFETATGKELVANVPHSAAVDGNTLVTYGAGMLIHWAVLAGDRLREYKLPRITESWLDILALAPDGRHLAIGCSDGRILILRLEAAGK